MLSLAPHLENATTTLELATRLGRVCLQHDEKIEAYLQNPVANRRSEKLVDLVRRMERTLWLTPGSNGNFSHVLEDEAFRRELEVVETYPPLECLAVLRGMLGVVRHVYDATTGTVDLKLGTPFPIAKRGINRLFEKATPDADTVGLQDLLWKTGFSLFAPRPGVPAAVKLDFCVAKQLDELAWTGREGRLPRIATLHPQLGADGIEIERKTDQWFFGVRPRRWDRDALLRQLRNVAGRAEIALLPELSLPQADALEAEVSAEPDAFPPLIVAGSAHVCEGDGEAEVRANESRIYLNGECVGRHRKIQPFRSARGFDGQKLPAPMSEGLTRERKTITVLSGDYTRMAVMICSDLISGKLTGHLEDAGVNLLLVPALTPEPGSFNGKICKLASDCQAVSVIANCDGSLFKGSERRGRKPKPFLVMAAVPRPRSREQSREYRRHWKGCPVTAVIDPNRRLRRSLRWL